MLMIKEVNLACSSRDSKVRLCCWWILMGNHTEDVTTVGACLKEEFREVSGLQ